VKGKEKLKRILQIYHNGKNQFRAVYGIDVGVRVSTTLSVMASYSFSGSGTGSGIFGSDGSLIVLAEL
jgi:hypothetical protein